MKICFTIVALCMFLCTSVTSTITINHNPNTDIFEEEFYRSYYQDDVIIYKLEKDGNEYGQAIWLKRHDKEIKTKYFASGDAPSRYKKWKEDTETNVVSVCSGAYSNDYDPSNASPVGICVDNGDVVNRTFDNSMDAIVIVESVGGIRVSNIENKDLNIRLEGGYQKIDVTNPFDRNTLFKWAEDVNATIFQTHLFAWKNQIQLNINSANKANVNDSRRVLALAFNENSELYYILFNIQKNVDFGDVAYNTLTYLEEQKNMKEVIAIINLDAGAYDIFSIFDSYGNPLNNLEGTNDDIDDATNLLIFHYSSN